ncbi:MAG: heme-binding protein HmuY [Leptospiraceae bacterium]|nr:heme-binding protein HmuY [Leptospiraceae bacterium]
MEKNLQIFKKSIFLILTLALAISNCTQKKSSENPIVDFLILRSVESAATAGEVKTTLNNGVYTTTVNATSNSDWVYVSLKNNGVKAGSTDSWDLKLQRMNIGTYSGTSVSSGGIGGACTNGSTDFNATHTAGECTKSVDEVLISSVIAGVVAAFNSRLNPFLSSPIDSTSKPANSPWYDYSGFHVITTRGFVYIITGSDGSKYILKISDYYNAAGTSGNPKFIWKKI